MADQLAESFAVPNFPIWKLTVDQYHQMIEGGILTEDDRVELLEGWLVTKMPKSPRHRLITQLTREALERLLPTGWFVDAQEPITLADSEPEPDIVIVRGERRDYADHHPTPADIGLVMEVSDTTLQRDRTLKGRLYARAGIPVYWIFNLVDTRLEAYSLPAETGGYQHRQDFEDVVSVVLDDQPIGQLSIRELLT